jgi:hypothetical protein
VKVSAFIAVCATIALPMLFGIGADPELSWASSPSGPRFKLKPGMTQAQAIRRVEQKFNRTPGFSNADCWMWGGNARIGWRHGSCVATFNYQGTTYGLKATYTPISCSRQRSVIVVSGLRTQSGTAPWKHDIFICGR